jgi:hypothetical protein
MTDAQLAFIRDLQNRNRRGETLLKRPAQMQLFPEINLKVSVKKSDAADGRQREVSRLRRDDEVGIPAIEQQSLF